MESFQLSSLLFFWGLVTIPPGVINYFWGIEAAILAVIVTGVIALTAGENLERAAVRAFRWLLMVVCSLWLRR